MRKLRKYAGFILGVGGVLLATVIICVCAFAGGGKTVYFKAAYYFVCYKMTDNATSASSLSGAAKDFGGAGYILEYGGLYYITVSCYYQENDAKEVCNSLKNKDLNCSVLEVKTKSHRLKGVDAKKNSELFLGNFNTLNSISSLAYECANRLDTGEYDQTKAKEIFKSVKSGLSGLLTSNPNNPFTEKLNYLLAECDDKEKGFIYSGDLRYIQIAIIDCIINIKIN